MKSGRTTINFTFLNNILFGDLVVISLTSTLQTGRNISSIFHLNIISASMEILQLLFGESGVILFVISS